MEPKHDPERGEDDQLWIGWKWFELHAKQRLEMFKFFLTIFGALITVSSAFIQTSYVFVAAVASFLALGAVIIFWQLDRRNLQLIGIGEAVLQHRWDGLGFPEDLNPIIASSVIHSDGVRFKHALLIVFIAAWIGAFIMFCFAIYLLNYPQHISVPRMH